MKTIINNTKDYIVFTGCQFSGRIDLSTAHAVAVVGDEAEYATAIPQFQFVEFGESHFHIFNISDIGSYPLLDIQTEFQIKASEWERERPNGVDISAMAMHHAYQHIIGMGPAAVPLLLERLELKPEHWFWALHAITGANPVPPEHEGNIDKMAEAWINWGKEQGYRW